MINVLVIVSKGVFESSFASAKPGDVLPIDRYTSSHRSLEPLRTGGRLFLVTVRPPSESLWLIAMLDQPKFVAGAWIAAANTVPVRDATSARNSIRFTSGAGMSLKPGALAMSLQTPRMLTDEDAALLLGTSVESELPKQPAAANGPVVASGPRIPKKQPKRAQPLRGVVHPTLDDIARFAERIERLCKRFPDRQSALRLAPPLSELAVSAFEAEHGIKLPADYRFFLLTVGASGGGLPGYGLWPLADEESKGIYTMADAFPEPESTADNLMGNIGGCIALGTDGCAMDYVLVVSGTAYGQVWGYVDARPGYLPILGGKPCAADGTPLSKIRDQLRAHDGALLPCNRPLRHSFGSWYDAWLREAEAGKMLPMADREGV